LRKVAVLSSSDAVVTELSLRAIRIVETRLSNMLGDVSTAETTKLLAMELSEVDNQLSLAGALAAVGAVGVIMLAQAQSVETTAVVAQIRSLMTPLI
jgi:hypothetical protein